jgi:NADH dehydrogenase [ubiquinone] 1 alpha subcomplex assembly factor 1
MERKHTLITDFSNLASQQWQIVNDGVMGGKSESQFQINEDGNGLFLGKVSLKNSGGFASVFNRQPLNLGGFSSIRLRVRSDGKRYSFRVKTGTGESAAPWWYESRFETVRDEWLDIILPLKGFTPTYRGREPKNAPPLNPEKIIQYGFLISDKQQGEFRIEVESIEAILLK